MQALSPNLYTAILEMEYRPVGRAGSTVSHLCVGCMTFGRKTEEDEAIRMVACAADAGNTFPGDRTPGAGRETESGPDIAGPL